MNVGRGARTVSKSAEALVALGVFLVALALLSRFYAYPKVAVAPIDQDSVSTMVGPNANLFDPSSLTNITTDLTTTIATIGDVEAARAVDDNTDVWVNTSSSKDSDGVVRSRSVDRAAFDGTTAEAVNCCGEYYEVVAGEQEPVRHRGLVFKFPFDTQKKTYQFWDGTLRRALPIQYAGVADVRGVPVYRFVQIIEPTVSGASAVPADVLGLDRGGDVRAALMYSNNRTLWVEPRTGVILDRTEEQYNTIRYQGEDRLVTTAVTTGYDDATVKANVDTYGPEAGRLNLLRNVVPRLALVLGLLLAVVGVVLPAGVRPRRRRS